MKFKPEFKKIVVCGLIGVTVCGMFLSPENVKEIAVGFMMGCFALLKDSGTPKDED